MLFINLQLKGWTSYKLKTTSKRIPKSLIYKLMYSVFFQLCKKMS